MSSTAAQPSSRRFSLAQLLLLLPWVALVIDAWSPIRDNSFLWHIRAGELQAAAGEVLTADPFSFTMLGTPWLTQSWLAELLYGWGEDATGGLGFVPPMLLLVSLAAFVGIALLVYRRSRSVVATVVVLLLSTVLLVSFLVPRPVIFSFALFPLAILAWDNPRVRWALPFIFWIWASVHGSFILGLAYVGLTLLSRKEWKALPVAVVSGLITLATAHGLGVLQMLADFAQARESLALLSEWRRPEALSVVFTPFLIGVAILILGAYRRRILPRDLWVIVPFIALALTANRAVPPAWLALVPLVATSLEDLGREAPKRFSVVSAVVFAVVALLIPVFLRDDGALGEERFPVAALAQLEDVPTFHDDRTGGYLIWAEGPERLVYLDDRAELYGKRIDEFDQVRRGELDWEPVFDRDGIEQVLLRTDETLIEALEDSGWTATYEDENYVVLRP